MPCRDFPCLCLGHSRHQLVRNLDGHYSMINGQDQWEIASTSTVKFAPSLVISPSRTVRILGQQSKSEEPPAARLDIVMGVLEEFLLTELWYCQEKCTI